MENPNKMNLGPDMLAPNMDISSVHLGQKDTKSGSATGIPPALEKYIATRDRKMRDPVRQFRLNQQFRELLDRGRVEVGGRASCGGRVDPTWLFYTSWNEIVRKAESYGFVITSTPVKHGNKSPTTAGGFWYSNIYQLSKGIE